MFTLKFKSEMEEVKLQMEFAPPEPFKTIDDAEDWGLMNLPRGLYVEVYDGRGTLRAEGYVGQSLKQTKVKGLL